MAEARRQPRLVLVVIAGAFLVLGVTLGVVYLRLWTRASEDLSRLLPQTTRAWMSSPAPWLEVMHTLELDHWADRNALSRDLIERGYLASAGHAGEIAGLSVDLARDILRGMDAFEIAVVPTNEGVTTMIFVEVRDLLVRRRIIERLQPLTEAVSRHVGFRIDAIHQSPWQRFTGIDPEPPRVVVMDPWIVFAWGAEQGLDDVLEARVGGRRDSIRKRDGFRERGDPNDFRVVIDAASLWQLAHGALDPDVPPPDVPSNGLLEFLGRLELVGKPDDTAELTLDVDDRELASRLRLALTSAPHPQLARLPSDAQLALSFTTHDLARLSDVLRELAERLSVDFDAHIGPTALADKLLGALTELETGGEVTLAFLPSPSGLDWVATVTPIGNPQAVESLLARSLARRFGSDYAHGEALMDDTRLHAEVPHGPLDPHGQADAPTLAWRIRDGTIEVAESRATLRRLEVAEASRRTLGQSGRLARARAKLPSTTALAMVAAPDVLGALDEPMLALFTERLDPTFMLAASLDASGDQLLLRTNVGVWSFATSIAAATRDQLESFALPALDPACRAAHFAMCRLYPDAVPCRPFSIGRRARILAACEALRRGGGIEP